MEMGVRLACSPIRHQDHASSDIDDFGINDSRKREQHYRTRMDAEC